MLFEWDVEKEKVNQKKHKVAFSEACHVFADEWVLSFYDDEHSDVEDRWISIGRASTGNILVVVHTYEI